MSIQEYIENDLEQKILSGKNIPEKLTLHYLSNCYQVSTRPVRLALQKLLDKNVLIKLDNARIAPNPKKLSSKKNLTIIAPPTNHYQIILEDLVKQSLNNSKNKIYIREEELAERFGISRTPIRSILQVISNTGLIEHQKRIGWLLVPFSLKDYKAFNDIRALMEVHALEVAFNQLDKEKIKIYLSKNYIDKENLFHLDNDFHQYIIDTCDNRYIQDFFKRYQPFFQLFILGEDNLEEAQIALDYHHAILNAILQNQKSKAKSNLKDHILSSKTQKG